MSTKSGRGTLKAYKNFTPLLSIGDRFLVFLVSILVNITKYAVATASWHKIQLYERFKMRSCMSRVLYLENLNMPIDWECHWHALTYVVP